MNKNIVIAGGGTGGHIYPGVAIARALQKLDSNLDVHFVGTAEGLESKVVPREGFPLHLIPVGKLNNNVPLLERLKTLLTLPYAFWLSYRLLRRLKPQAVVGVGGYVSGPFVLLASWLNIKTAIWEPNAYPGLANRWLARFVDKTFVVFAEAAKYFRAREVEEVGLPVRAELMSSLPAHSPGMEAMAMNKDRAFRVFIFGGSQGARPINNVVVEALTQEGPWQNVEFIHQTGKLDFAKIQQAYQNKKAQVEVLEYVHDMAQKYAWADLVICRAGVSTLAELAACGKASVLIPFPHAADNHQQKNAELFANAQAAQMLLQKDWNAKSFANLIVQYQNNPKQLIEFSGKVRQFHRAHAAEQIAERILSL